LLIRPTALSVRGGGLSVFYKEDFNPRPRGGKSSKSILGLQRYSILDLRLDASTQTGRETGAGQSLLPTNAGCPVVRRGDLPNANGSLHEFVSSVSIRDSDKFRLTRFSCLRQVVYGLLSAEFPHGVMHEKIVKKDSPLSLRKTGSFRYSYRSSAKE
jgi:hypothetical protein